MNTGYAQIPREDDEPVTVRGVNASTTRSWLYHEAYEDQCNFV